MISFQQATKRTTWLGGKYTIVVPGNPIQPSVSCRMMDTISHSGNSWPSLVQWHSFRKHFYCNCDICVKLTNSKSNLFLSVFSFLIFPTRLPPTAAVPASPCLSQCTCPPVSRCHPCSGWRSSLDGSGEPGSGWPRDVESAAEGEGQAVPWFGAHCIWGTRSQIKWRKIACERNLQISLVVAVSFPIIDMSLFKYQVWKNIIQHQRNWQ